MAMHSSSRVAKRNVSATGGTTDVEMPRRIWLVMEPDTGRLHAFYEKGTAAVWLVGTRGCKIAGPYMLLPKKPIKSAVRR